VPLLTVMLAVFAAFPMFASFQDALQKYFLQTLVPDTSRSRCLPR
jgi:membrane protein